MSAPAGAATTTFGASIATSIITAAVALVHSPEFTYLEKVWSVCVLAAAAELSRGFVTKLRDKKKK